MSHLAKDDSYTQISYRFLPHLQYQNISLRAVIQAPSLDQQNNEDSYKMFLYYENQHGYLMTFLQSFGNSNDVYWCLNDVKICNV